MNDLAVSNSPRLTGAPLAFRISPRGEMGLFDVTVSRGNREIYRSLYLENPEKRERFLDDAVKKLCDFHERPQLFREEIQWRLAEAVENYHFTHARPVLERMSEMIDHEFEWIWPDRIAKGKLTMLLGDPDIGKSLVALDVAARITTGQPWPDEPADTPPRDPASVLLLDETDNPYDTILPRLLAAGADLERIEFLRGVALPGIVSHTEQPYSLAGSPKMIENALHKIPQCEMLIIDPLSICLSSVHSSREAQSMLKELVGMAGYMGIAVLVLNYQSRSASGLFSCRSGSNFAFAAAARSVWSLFADRQQPNRRLLLPMKNNLGSDSHGLAFRIETCTEYEMPHVVWEDSPIEMTVEKTTPNGSARSLPNTYAAQRELTLQWLREQLLTGERLAQEILAAARQERIAEKALRRALRELGGITQKGPEGRYVWLLPDESTIVDSEEIHDEIVQVGDENDVAKLANLTNLEISTGKSSPMPDLESEPLLP